MILCFHNWSFPRRHPEFEGRRNADVQTCLTCGRRKLSKVQFGPESQKLHASANYPGAALKEEEASA